ncbi:glycoside hydrolase family 25 protein [Tsuneonella sp. YG55]|uniref:Glycoside hydrolase family 25 protein n=1 Tax=Tsuneonella litorea TaxID=2976475 RepID=A0A9X2W057_9SPHN|nr:glycoside hydrolase family 25 protein [Tsuneonella litorea]MCT2557455.1 glycoside hydrolase family 25 protein [Tsuneonella litorea]
MGRKRRSIGWRARALAALLLAALVAAGWGWWRLHHWTPDAAALPDQGAEVSAADGAVRFATLKALGAGFVYLDAGDGARRDPAFAANLAAARAAGLSTGAVHRFDPCLMADGQSASFVVVVPRGGDMLPPAIALDKTADDCPVPVGEAEVESELMTFINQIEAHSGKPAILQVSRAFENRYGLASRLERNLWVVGTWRMPTYAGRPWLMWTANEGLWSDASDGPLRWVVVRP